MKVTILDEPDLEFANGSRHIDPRHGITNYGPADADDTSVRTIRAGIIGPQQAIAGVKRWLDTCRQPVRAKTSHLGHLYIPFPGFDTDRGFRSTIAWNSRLERPILQRDLTRLQGLNPLEAVMSAVELYDAELAALHEEPNCDVVIVCRPDNLPERDEPQSDRDKPWLTKKATARLGMNFQVPAQGTVTSLQSAHPDHPPPDVGPGLQGRRGACSVVKARRGHSSVEPAHRLVLQSRWCAVAAPTRGHRTHQLLRRRRVLQGPQ